MDYGIMDADCCLEEQQSEVSDGSFYPSESLREAATTIDPRQAKGAAAENAKKQPSALFERGVCIARDKSDPGMTWMAAKVWYVVGRLASGIPFMLMYSGSGFTNWTCEEHLGDPLRKRILDLFRNEVRRATELPSWITLYDLSEHTCGTGGYNSASAAIVESFYRDIWRGEYLHQPDEDVDLDVPYAEKDLAKAEGARWDPVAKKWKAKRMTDMSRYARWLPAVAAPVEI